jgi:hypothetical protein
MSRTDLSRCLAAFAAILLALGAVACGGEQANVMSDPSGRITFELPDGWTEAVGSSGTRFSPPVSGAQVQVNTVDDNGRTSLTERRDAWLDFHRRNGAEVILERDWPGDNLPGIEYAHSAENVRGEIIWHHILLSGDGYVVPTYLQVSRGTYDDLLPVYREIVASIRPAVAE